MRNPVIWIIILIALAAVMLSVIAGSRPEADGPDAGPTTPHALVDG